MELIVLTIWACEYRIKQLISDEFIALRKIKSE